jgi:predicted hotdog family 3-hydroxylacyl-ACP dehydratase
MSGALSELIPHQGGMCLNERVLAWDDARADARDRHAPLPDNPLRRDDRLRAIHLCEYGAQAMAVHAGLLAQARGGRARPGMLVSLRGVTLAVQRIDDLPGELTVEAECVLAGEDSAQYAFRVLHEGRLLAEGPGRGDDAGPGIIAASRGRPCSDAHS